MVSGGTDGDAFDGMQTSKPVVFQYGRDEDRNERWYALWTATDKKSKVAGVKVKIAKGASAGGPFEYMLDLDEEHFSDADADAEIAGLIGKAKALFTASKGRGKRVAKGANPIKELFDAQRLVKQALEALRDEIIADHACTVLNAGSFAAGPGAAQGGAARPDRVRAEPGR